MSKRATKAKKIYELGQLFNKMKVANADKGKVLLIKTRSYNKSKLKQFSIGSLEMVT